MGAMTTGPLCRQRGEPMTSYISRRTRWWVRIKELDRTFSATEILLADYLLDTESTGHIGMMAVAMNAEYRHVKDHCAPGTSIPQTSVLRPSWVQGHGAIWTRIIPAKIRDPEPGRVFGAEY